MDRRAITWLARYSVRVVPAERRDWAEAVWAEAGEVPARGRLPWVTAGLWLVAKEAGMFRRIGYWLGIAALAVGAAGVVSLVWRGTPVAPGYKSVSFSAAVAGSGVYIDPHTTESYRTLAIATVVLLAALPWLSRRRSVFGPVGDSVAARVLRVVGCGAICVLVLVLARLAQSLGEDLAGAGAPPLPAGPIVMGVITAYLAVFFAIGTRRWSPRWATRLSVEMRLLIGMAAVVVGFVLFLLDPAWWLITAYLLGIFAVTARGSRITRAALVFGAGAGIAGGLIWYASVSTEGVFLHANPWLVPVVAVVVFAAPAMAGAAAAWCTPAQDDAEALMRECTQQGFAAGALTGAAAALLITISVLGTMVVDHLQFGPHSTEIYLFVALFGPPLGAVMGIIGGSGVAGHRSGARPEGLSAQAPAPVPPAI
jgi:hypothetical protein